jgi:hypothetical protein
MYTMSVYTMLVLAVSGSLVLERFAEAIQTADKACLPEGESRYSRREVGSWR